MSQLQTQPVVPPVKDQATLNAETAAKNASQVPPKFKNADGTVNIEALAAGYRALEVKQSQAGQQPPVAPATPAVPAVENVDDLLAQAQVQQVAAAATFEEILNPQSAAVPVVVEWSKIQNELVTTGTLSVETVNAMKAGGIPEAVIKTTIQGYQAAKREQFQKAATLVGGQEELTKILGWVNKTATPEQRQNVLAALRGPAGETVLAGLHTQYRRSLNPEGSPLDTSAQLTGGMGAAQTHIVPFATSAEMEQAMNDPKYQFDPNFQKMVAARMAVTRGRTPQEAARLLK